MDPDRHTAIYHGSISGKENPESWNHAVMTFSPLPWMYQFAYLKYLFIVIPGTIAGEYLYGWLQSKQTTPSIASNNDEHKRMPWILLLTIGLIILNLYGLYMRYLLLNLAGSIIILSILYVLLQIEGKMPIIGTGYLKQVLIWYYWDWLLKPTKEASGKILLPTATIFCQLDLHLWL